MSVQRCPHCAYNLVADEPFTYGNVAIAHGGEITFEGTRVALPKTQSVIAQALIRAKGRRLTHEYLVNTLDKDIFDYTVRKHIQRTRECFRRILPSFDQIVSAHGFGAYQWAFRTVRIPTPLIDGLESERRADDRGPRVINNCVV